MKMWLGNRPICSTWCHTAGHLREEEALSVLCGEAKTPAFPSQQAPTLTCQEAGCPQA